MLRFWSRWFKRKSPLPTLHGVLEDARRSATVKDRSKTRLAQHLDWACRKIGHLDGEEALWILIPTDRMQRATTIDAMWGSVNLPVRLPDLVVYTPTKEQIHELLQTALQCEWVIHTHNHPRDAGRGRVGQLGASRSDCAFARSWRRRLPEVSARLRFFVVQGNDYVEYEPYQE